MPDVAGTIDGRIKPENEFVGSIAVRRDHQPGVGGMAADDCKIDPMGCSSGSIWQGLSAKNLDGQALEYCFLGAAIHFTSEFDGHF